MRDIASKINLYRENAANMHQMGKRYIHYNIELLYYTTYVHIVLTILKIVILF